MNRTSTTVHSTHTARKFYLLPTAELVMASRLMGIMSAIVATYANTSTPVPIYLCAALYIVMAIVAACFPFEPLGRRSS
ncbi:Filamentous Growth Regulator [Recurvomyces mirabilis]|uniref:Filamentous Growth Regulator n=1 Tax=Recurvomyces mirabilis TaxID=574656 RepID=A0AAE0WID6_9PEZI|nr:Filamentous Growth Regulator [Recurvomyces mirabilis]KAK5150298.1 Major Facilitator superfamily [Recurvomyces mirabilis]